MHIEFDGQLITTSITAEFRGKSILINDVIVDTGSSHTIFSPDILEKIGVKYEKGDYVFESYGIGGKMSFYCKTLDEVKIGDFSVRDVTVDIGMLPKDHTGLLGLDILKTYQFIIDLERMILNKGSNF
jgi:predicted aspartyl protease